MNVNWDYRAGSAMTATGVRIDPAFARGAVFADAESVDAVVRPVCGIDPSAVCEIVNVGYVPGRELRTVFRFGSSGSERVVRVDFPPAGTSRDVYERAAAKARRADDVVWLSAWDAVAWVLPADDRLPALDPLLDPAAGPAVVASVLGGESAAVAPGRLLAYVPRRRAVVRYDGPHPVIAKAGRMRDERECHARQRTLQDLPGRGFLMPRPLGVDSELGIRFEAWVDGQPVENVIAAGTEGGAVHDVMATLAGVHGLPIGVTTARIGADDLTRQLADKTLGRLVATLPGQAVRITRLADELHARPPAAGSNVTLHGDFHPGNVLMSADGPVVIDLDNLAVGPIERDLAVFAGRLVLLGIKDGWRSEAIRLAFDLPDRYRDAGGRAVDREAFGWYLAMTMLVRQVSNAVRRLAPNLSEVADVCLDVGERALASATAGGRVS